VNAHIVLGIILMIVIIIQMLVGKNIIKLPSKYHYQIIPIIIITILILHGLLYLMGM